VLPLLDDEPDTAPAGLRERKKQRARATIADAALELFASQGFDDTTVAEVAARAEVSPATVTRYFPTKESLLFPERELNTASLRDAIAARPAQESPFAAVVAALTVPAELGDDDRRRLLRSRQAMARSAALRGRSLELLGVWRDTVAEAAVDRGADAAAARVLATVVVAVLDDVTDQWALDEGRTDLNRAIAEAFAALARSQRRTP
jgi:AcrR family transcriptional regulator